LNEIFHFGFFTAKAQWRKVGAEIKMIFGRFFSFSTFWSALGASLPAGGQERWEAQNSKGFQIT